MEIYRLIEQSIATRKPITIVYHGGSQPGSVRDIAPIRKLKNGNISARCYRTKQVKTFKIERMQVMDKYGVLTENYKTG